MMYCNSLVFSRILFLLFLFQSLLVQSLTNEGRNIGKTKSLFSSKSMSLQMVVDKIPSSISSHFIRNINTAAGALITFGAVLPFIVKKSSASASQRYPIYGDEKIMEPKNHGTSDKAVQNTLKWGCDVKLADRICNFNRRWAENSGYFKENSSFLRDTSAKDGELTFYDSVTGLPLFKAPKGRSYDKFVSESLVHGWPSFRDEEVVWENVRVLRDGETVSLTGTHLGHNLPDFKGNRYCINLVCIAGQPSDV